MSRLSNLDREKTPKISLVASSSRAGDFSSRALKHVVPLKKLRSKRGDEIVVFLLKVAALETIRRISRAKCPVLWRIVQALQILGFPPFKGVRRWELLRFIVGLVQKFSRPFLCLSIATTLFDHSEASEGIETRVVDSQPDSGSPPNEPSTSDTRKCDESDDNSKSIVSENWLNQLSWELEKEGLSLPERIDEDELHRFYTATKGNIPSLLSSLKRTIRWRETYYLLSQEELESWSMLVFWHGFDRMFRPCLVIRLGHACSSLPPQDRPRFSQAIVSQIEHGVLNLVNEVDPRITVLMDCEGLSPIRFPMQMLKSCATILQDHYPNRLAVLFLVRLPPVSRVITQTFLKVLKPATRQKLRIEGETYHKVLSEFLQSLPAILGGSCSCPRCRMLIAGKTRDQIIEESSKQETSNDSSSYVPSPVDYPVTEFFFSRDCEYYLRAAVLGFLMIWIIMAFVAGMSL